MMLSLLLDLEETSVDCLRNAGCVFEYVYGFCVCVCTAFVCVYRFCIRLCKDFAHIHTFDFAHVVQIMRTYTAYIL